MAGSAQMTESSEQSFSWLYGVILGWVLGLFTLPLAKDAEAKEKCLNKLYDLKRSLEKLSKNMRSPTRSEQRYYEYLMEAKLLIESLDVNRMGMAFSSYDLKDLITQSSLVFRKLDPDHQNPAFHVPQTAVRLIMIWNGSQPISRDFEPIEKIQRFIGRTLPGRFFSCLGSFIQRLFSRKKKSEE